MIKIFFKQGLPIKIEWQIMKGHSDIPEDLSSAALHTWVISPDDKIYVGGDTSYVDGKVVIDLASMNPHLPANIYSLKAMWYKDGNMEKMSLAEVYQCFAVTNYEEEATPYPGSSVTIKIKSASATYGKDGLSAYEIALMRGTTTATSEKEWSYIRSTEIEPGGVTTEKLRDKCVTSEKIAADVFPTLVKPLTDDLQNQIDSIQAHGVAVSNTFGDDPHISISQKTLTDAVQAIWDKIDEITGEDTSGIEMTVTPDYYIDEGDGCTLTIHADSSNAQGKFDKIRFYADNVFLSGAEDVISFETTAHVTTSVMIKCVAQILGKTYTKEHYVTRYTNCFLGAGSTFAAIMDAEHSIPVTDGMRGSYDVTCEQGDYIFIVMPAEMKDVFVRADMNGFEIPMSMTIEEVDDVSYAVFKSDSTYVAGTYNLDLNS